MADKNILAAYDQLAKSNAKQADIAGSFAKSLGLSERKKEREKRIQESNARVSESMSKLDSKIDMTSVEDPALRAVLGEWAMSEKNKYATAANYAAKVDDPSSQTAMGLAEEMNRVNDEFVSVRNEMTGLDKMRLEYKRIMTEEDGFSTGADPEVVEAMEAIFGSGAQPKIKGGHIVYEVNGKEYSVKDLKLPTQKAYGKAKDLLDQNAGFADKGQELSAENEQMLRNKYKIDLANEDQLRSLLADGDFGDIIPTEDIDVKEIGFEAARDIFIDRLIEANKASALKGKKEKDAKAAKGGGSDSGKDLYKLPNGAVVSYEMKGVYDELVKTTELLLAPGSSTDVPKAPPAYNIGTSSSPYIIAWDMNSKTWYHEDTSNGVIDEFESPMDIVVRNQSLFK